jgi:hypothetical protein
MKDNVEETLHLKLGQARSRHAQITVVLAISPSSVDSATAQPRA